MLESNRDTGLKVQSAKAKWWETAEDHRFALEVLQLGVRREILKFIGSRTRTEEEIGREFGLSSFQAEFHLVMLEKALVIERTEEAYRLTQTGIAYLSNVEHKR